MEGLCGRVGGGRYAVFVDVGDDGMILSQDGEDKGRRTCGEVVEVIEGEWSEEEG